MDKQKETYLHRDHCENCGNCVSFELPKGVRVSTVKRELVCPTCGCLIRTPDRKQKAC